MLDTNTETAEAVVVRLLIFGQGVVFRFLVRNLDVGMIVLQSLITAVGINTGAFRQAWPASSHRDIGRTTRRRIGTATLAIRQ